MDLGRIQKEFANGRRALRDEAWEKVLADHPEHVLPVRYEATDELAHYRINVIQMGLLRNGREDYNTLVYKHGGCFKTEKMSFNECMLGDFEIHCIFLVFPDRETKLMCELDMSISHKLKALTR